MIQPVQSFQWEGHPLVVGAKSGLRSLGFREIGPFVPGIADMPEFLAAYYPAAHCYGMILRPAIESGQEVVALELCCQLDASKGGSVTSSETEQTWHRPPRGIQLRLPQAPLGLLFRTLLDKVSGLDREAATADLFQEDFLRYRA